MRQAAPLAGPLATAVLAVLGFIQRRSPASRLRGRCLELTALAQQVPDRDRPQLEEEISAYVREIRSEYHYDRVRRLSGVTVATIIFVASVAGAAIAVAVWIGAWWVWALAMPIVLFCLALEWAGTQQLYEVPSDDTISPERAHRRTAKSN